MLNPKDYMTSDEIKLRKRWLLWVIKIPCAIIAVFLLLGTYVGFVNRDIVLIFSFILLITLCFFLYGLLTTVLIRNMEQCI